MSDMFLALLLLVTRSVHKGNTNLSLVELWTTQIFDVSY